MKNVESTDMTVPRRRLNLREASKSALSNLTLGDLAIPVTQNPLRIDPVLVLDMLIPL